MKKSADRKDRVTRFADRLWSDLPTADDRRWQQVRGDRLGIAYSAPLFLLALGWLLRTTTLNPGIPLGIEATATWTSRLIELGSGDTLVLYTDGVTEAQSQQRELFDEQRLLAVIQGHLGLPPNQLLQAILTAVDEFVGDAPQYADITLLILARNDQLDNPRSNI